MAKRRKTRTHVPVAKNAPKDGMPKSFVIKSGSAGQVGSSVGQLVKDVRRVMEPNTASHLRERRGNRLKDFIAMAGPLGVTHMLIFSQSEHDASSGGPSADDAAPDLSSAVNLRICRVPRGPTLTFKVLRYSLASDVVSASRRPRSPGNEYATEPLLILNNFSASEDRSLQLMTTMFQNLFPSLQVATMRLTQARRVVLLSYNPTTHTIEFRHYLISVRSVGVSRTVRKIVEGGRRRPDISRGNTPVEGKGKGKALPDMSNAQDVADYVLGLSGSGFVTSDSEAEPDVGGSEVDSGAEGGESTKIVKLPQDFVGRGNRRGEQRAIRLTELGPRMELGLVKIEEGIGAGNVLFHEYIKKSKAEEAALAKTKAEQKAATAKRRKEQEDNVRRKREAKEAEREAKMAKRKAKAGDADDEDDSKDDKEAIEEEGTRDVEAGQEHEDESDLDDFEIERTVFGEEGDGGLDEDLAVGSSDDDDGPFEDEAPADAHSGDDSSAFDSEEDELPHRPPPKKAKGPSTSSLPPGPHGKANSRPSIPSRTQRKLKADGSGGAKGLAKAKPGKGNLKGKR